MLLVTYKRSGIDLTIRVTDLAKYDVSIATIITGDDPMKIWGWLERHFSGCTNG
ncbi:hypothetical protein SPHINGO8BC_50250 [Sphingobacterium multivorum]|jgi:hypothetical protein|uniref:Uncharacterized protein n=1 Tax=Sphingobacterium multivorum TaxID=28454 RepID=A0A654BPI2_SPHMU|nr:hypothetical protein SPHINGO8BC_50250 [Sphingobacterium multivorum]